MIIVTSILEQNNIKSLGENWQEHRFWSILDFITYYSRSVVLEIINSFRVHTGKSKTLQALIVGSFIMLPIGFNDALILRTENKLKTECCFAL